MTSLIGSAWELRRRIKYSLDERRLNRLGLYRIPRERQYPRTPGTLEGLCPYHVVRYGWARPFCKGKRVLDYGCGVGYGTFILSDTAEYVRGYDISPEALAWADYYARQRPNLEFSTELPSEPFECIVCFECIEHIPDPETVLDWLAEHVRQFLFISTPEPQEGEKWSPFHVREFTKAEFQHMLEKRFRTVDLEDQLVPEGFSTIFLARCSH